MKNFVMTLFAMLAIATGANAMSYEQARNEALFLTDKMAYELNLTDDQYEAAYEINLDYLMSVTGRDDVFGTYWERRNLDLGYILYSWQWEAYRAASYFYRPLYRDAGYWHFGVYAHYPRRDYFYFGRPSFYNTYRGGHSWRMNGGRSFYEGRRDHFRIAGNTQRNHVGMRDGWDRGDYRGQGRSSTRVTGRNRNGGGNWRNGRGGSDTYRNNNSRNSNDGYSIPNGPNSSNRSGGRVSGGSRTNGPDMNGSRSSSSTYDGNRSSSSYGSSRQESSSFGSSRSSSSAGSRSEGNSYRNNSRSESSFGNSRSNSDMRSGGSFSNSRSSSTSSSSRYMDRGSSSSRSITPSGSSSRSIGSMGSSSNSHSVGGASRSISSGPRSSFGGSRSSSSSSSRSSSGGSRNIQR